MIDKPIHNMRELAHREDERQGEAEQHLRSICIEQQKTIAALSERITQLEEQLNAANRNGEFAS